MGMRTVHDPQGGVGPYIDKSIGNAYRNVALVAQKLDQISYVALYGDAIANKVASVDQNFTAVFASLNSKLNQASEYLTNTAAAASTVSGFATTASNAARLAQDLADDVTYQAGLIANVGAGTGVPSYISRANAVIAIIPTAVTYLETQGYYVPGDGGAARYQRVSVQPNHPGKFQDAAGGWWGMVYAGEHLIEQFGGKGDGITDATAAVNNALLYCFTMGGGTVVAMSRPYLINTAVIIIDKNCVLKGTGKPSLIGASTSDVNYGPRLLVNPAYSISVRGQGRLENMAVIRSNWKKPTNAAEVRVANLEMISPTLGGTGVVMGDPYRARVTNDVKVQDIIVIGFHKGIDWWHVSRGFIENVHVDAWNAINIDGSYDVSYLSNTHTSSRGTEPLGGLTEIYDISYIQAGANNAFRVTTTIDHKFVDGDEARVGFVKTSGTPNAFGVWTVKVIDARTVDLVTRIGEGSTGFSGAYVSGGKISWALTRRITGTGLRIKDVDGINIINHNEHGHGTAVWIDDKCVGARFYGLNIAGNTFNGSPEGIGIKCSGSGVASFFGGTWDSTACAIYMDETCTGARDQISVYNVFFNSVDYIFQLRGGAISLHGCTYGSVLQGSNNDTGKIYIGPLGGQIYANGCYAYESTVVVTEPGREAIDRLKLFEINAINRFTVGRTITNQGQYTMNARTSYTVVSPDVRITGDTVRFYGRAPDGTVKESLRINGDGSVNHLAGNEVITVKGLHRMRTYTRADLLATNPPSTELRGAISNVSNPPANTAPLVVCDGSKWVYMDGTQVIA